jgi:hypothetical protein
MTTYYVGPSAAGDEDGSSWANRYGSLNDAENTPVVAGDTVYVGPGTYRELLTCDVSGSSGNLISYIGDYTGEHTDGVGGVIRITGSDNDTTRTRDRCIYSNSKNYRLFRGFSMDMVAEECIQFTSSNYWTIDECCFSFFDNYALFIPYSNNATISNCYFLGTLGDYLSSIRFYGAPTDDTANVISNCIFDGGYRGIWADSVGGVTIKNSAIMKMAGAGVYSASLSTDQTTTANNCLLLNCSVALESDDSDEFDEDYNSIVDCLTARTNVNVGGNSNTYPALFDTRWFHELANGGRLVTPFDLASYSELIDVAGTSPTTTDMRGTSAINSVREWGSLEYDSTLFKKWVNRGMMGCG